ncbi:MAG: polysaccharide biosynthesis protein [Frankiales bacterium]|nr:polysaccharide biosynthesis protein [Frankiales bacterium]
MKIRYGATVGAGLVLFGVSSYLFLGMAARACHPTRFAALSVLWLLTVTVGIGLFLPLEQELARSVAELRAHERPVRPVLNAGLRAAMIMLLAVGAASLLALSPLHRALGRDFGMVAAVELNLVAQAMAYVLRGVAAGGARYGAYAAQLALEGLLRVVAAAALARGGVHAAAPFGYALAGSTALSVLLVAPRLAFLMPAREGSPDRRRFGANLRWLVLAAFASQALANSAPLLVYGRVPADSAQTARFFAALLVARIPLFLFAAVQAVLLPGLAAALARGDDQGFSASLRRVELAVLALGGSAVLVTAAAGGPVLRWVFGQDYQISGTTLVLLALGSALFVIANVEGQAALARRRHRAIAGTWTVACAIGVGVAWLPGDVLRQVSLAFVVGSVFAVLALLPLARVRGRERREARRVLV